MGKIMPQNQISIFATSSDLRALIDKVCQQRALRFAIMEMSNQPLLNDFSDLNLLEQFKAYLVADIETRMISRKVKQKDGSELFATDQLDNPDTIVINCGGCVGSQGLVAGQIGTATRGKKSEKLFVIFSKEVRKEFEKINSYYVGPEAADLLDGGARLMPTRKSPPAYDLVRPEPRAIALK